MLRPWVIVDLGSRVVNKYFSAPRNLLIRGLVAGYKLSLYQGRCQRNEDRLINIDSLNKCVVTLYFLKHLYYWIYKTGVPAIYGLKYFLIRKICEQAFKSYVIVSLIHRGSQLALCAGRNHVASYINVDDEGPSILGKTCPILFIFNPSSVFQLSKMVSSVNPCQHWCNKIISYLKLIMLYRYRRSLLESYRWMFVLSLCVVCCLRIMRYNFRNKVTGNCRAACTRIHSREFYHSSIS